MCVAYPNSLKYSGINLLSSPKPYGCLAWITKFCMPEMKEYQKNCSKITKYNYIKYIFKNQFFSIIYLFWMGCSDVQYLLDWDLATRSREIIIFSCSQIFNPFNLNQFISLHYQHKISCLVMRIKQKITHSIYCNPYQPVCIGYLPDISALRVGVQARVGKSINIWSWNLGWAMKTNIIKPL